MENVALGGVPMLVLVEGQKTRRWLLDSDQVVIGRDPGCEVLIPDRRVSRQHAEVVRYGDGFVLLDCDSKNGTFVNGDRVAGEHRLEDGDEIQLALCCQLIFVGPGATAPLSIGDAPSEGPLVLDENAHRVWVFGREVEPPLSAAQFRLLALLGREPGRVCAREEIVRAVWADEEASGISEQAIDALVRRLRERLAGLDAEHFVMTVRGHGFRLNLPEGDA